MPAEIKAAVKEEPARTRTLRAQVVTREELSSSFVQGSELEAQESHESPLPPTKQQLRWNSFARKLYDNITFEDEELEMSNRKQTNSANGLSSEESSKEWNPLFASSSHRGLDEEENEDNDDHEQSHADQRAGGMSAHCDPSLQGSCASPVPLMALLRNSNNDSDALLYYRKGSRVRIGCPTVTTFCLDVGKWQQKQQQQQQKQLGQEKSQQLADIWTEQDNQSVKSRSARDFSRNKAVSAFIARMVCCRTTPTRGSSF